MPPNSGGRRGMRCLHARALSVNTNLLGFWTRRSGRAAAPVATPLQGPSGSPTPASRSPGPSPPGGGELSSSLPLIGHRARLSTPRGRGELAERALLDLAYALRAHPQAGADVAQALLGPVDAVARAQDRALAVREPSQQREQLVDLDRVEDPLVLASRQRIGQQLAECPDGPIFAGDRLVGRARRAVGGQQ